MGAEDHAGEFAGAEGYDDAAPGRYAMAQRFGQTIGKRPIDRNGQADVDVFKKVGTQ